MVERLSSHGETKEAAIRLSAMQLSSALLHDSGFSLVARGTPQDNSYTVDLEAGTFLVRTRLYAVVSRRMSFFKVEIAGKIADGVFVVRNPVQGSGSVITRVEEEKLRRPSFFSSSLAQDCLRAQMDQERFGRFAETVGPEAIREVRLLLSLNGSKVPVSLRRKKTADHGKSSTVAVNRSFACSHPRWKNHCCRSSAVFRTCSRKGGCKPFCHRQNRTNLSALIWR